MRSNPFIHAFLVVPLSAVAIPVAANAQAASPAAVRIAIAPQPLSQALDELARQADLRVTFPAQLVAGKTSPGASGPLTARQALDQLLAGSGLVAVLEGSVVVIKAAAQAQAQAPAASALPAVKVTASASASATRNPDQIVERVSRGGALFGSSDLREVPFTVNVVTDAEIANRMAKTLGEALAGDPAVRNDYGGTGGYPTESFNIRGFQIGGGDAFLKDGMPMAGQVTQGTENLEQIEVIRGPMGFRYGFLPPGGAINLVTKQPTDTPLRSFTFSTDRYGSAKGHLDLGGRVGDDGMFGYRINAVLEDANLFFDPVERKRNFLSVALDWRATRDTTVQFSYDRNDFKSGPDLFHYTVPDINGQEIKGIKPDGYWGQRFLPDNKFVVQTASLGIESKLSQDLSLSSRFGLYDWDAKYALSTFATGPVASRAQPNGDFNVFISKSNNTQLSKTHTTFLNYKLGQGDVKHSLTGGFTWQKSDSKRSAGSVTGLLMAPGTATPVVNNFFNPVQFADTSVPVTGPMNKWVDREQYGVFVSDEARLGDRWRVVLALRHAKFVDKSAFRSAPSDVSSTDPTAGVMYEVGPGLSVYGSFATGLENGGLRAGPTPGTFIPLPPLKSRQIEVGTKSDLVDGGLTLDTALFRIEKEFEFTPTGGRLGQDGREVHLGGEVRLTGKVTRSLTVSTGVQWLQAELRGNPATEGQRPMNVPKVNATFSGDYRLSAVPGLFLTGAAYHSAKREIAVPNIAAKAPAYTRWDLGARYETQVLGHAVIGRINVENVTNEVYYNSGWYSLYEYGAPRTVSASLQVKF